MADKKKQHYVPKFYLDFFATGKMFYLFNLKTGKEIGLVNYQSQCYKNYFYGKDKILENQLAVFEGKWKTTFLEVLDNNFANLNNLREFVLYQYGRTVGFDKRIKETVSLQLTEVVKSQLAHEKKFIPEEKIKEVTDNRAQEIIKSSGNVDLTSHFVENINDLAFLKIHFDTKRTLISSDNPILLINPYLPPHVGLSMIGLVIIFPLTPRDLAVFYDSGVYTKFKGTQSIVSKNQSDLNHINSLIYANADEIIYSVEAFNDNALSEKNKNLRADNKKHKFVQTIGPEENKLVVTQTPTIFHDFNFSFLTIKPELYKIKGDYRDSVPRIYDEKFEKKLKDKTEDWMIDIMWRGFDIDKTAYKMGYKTYYEEILKYWKK